MLRYSDTFILQKYSFSVTKKIFCHNFRRIFRHHDLPIIRQEDPEKLRKYDQENGLFRIDYFDI